MNEHFECLCLSFQAFEQQVTLEAYVCVLYSKIHIFDSST